MAVIHIFKKYVLKRLKSWADATDSPVDDLRVREIEKSLVPAVYFGIFLPCPAHTAAVARIHAWHTIAAIVLVTLLLVRAVVSAVNVALASYLKHAVDADGGERQFKGVRGLVNFAIWVIALVFLLDNLGVKISSVVAGLGIGGIAVALAAQAVLGDLFGFFVIFFDKPFEIGDFIVVGDKMGALEYIGIKTTRMRALVGEMLIFSNKDLTHSRVHNFRKMDRRRVVFKLGVIYQTAAAKLRSIPRMVKGIIDAQQDAAFDRGHFACLRRFQPEF